MTNVDKLKAWIEDREEGYFGDDDYIASAEYFKLLTITSKLLEAVETVVVPLGFKAKDIRISSDGNSLELTRQHVAHTALEECVKVIE